MSGRGTRVRLAIASSASAVLVLSAPFMGQIRAALRAAFPSHFVALVGGTVGAILAVIVAAAVVRIRDRRAPRYTAMIAAFVLAAAYSLAFGTGTPEVDVVERVHFIEYGAVAFLFYRVWRPAGDLSMFALPLLAGVLVGTLEEWFQWFIPNRVGEARDVVLNLVAIGCGLLFSAGAHPPRRFSGRLFPGSRLRLAQAWVASVLVFAAFVHAVHLGHTIRDADAGIFESRYSSSQLERLGRDRAKRWAVDPPVVLRRLSREDQYLEEGLWHVRRRNRAWSSGDYTRAVGENRILEKYFVPVLDLPTDPGARAEARAYANAGARTDGRGDAARAAPERHRWPSDQRAEALRLGGHAPAASEVSDAAPYPIVVWPPLLLWTIATAAAALPAGILLRSNGREARTFPSPQVN